MREFYEIPFANFDHLYLENYYDLDIFVLGFLTVINLQNTLLIYSTI